MKVHSLYSNWTLYTHTSDDWDKESYIKMNTFNTLEHVVASLEYIPNDIIRNNMLFLMRDTIMPMWEDEHNKYGGSVSFKLFHETLPNIWRELCYYMISEDMKNKKSFDIRKSINGISISPKKGFSILKIWVSCDNVSSIQWLQHIKCIRNKKFIFKKHMN